MTPARRTTRQAPPAGAAAMLREPREVIRDEMAAHAPILRALQDGPLTVPALAERLGRPREEVVFWVMGMRRFGLLAETGEADDEGYFAYAMTERGRRS